jgi:hypothetical protein
MKRSLWMSFAALFAAGVFAPSAWGDEPTEFPAGVLCAFPLSIESSGEHGDTSTQQITNTLSGESISVRTAGSVTFTALPNGDQRATARGRSLQFFFAGDVNGPGLFLTKGVSIDIFDSTTGAATSSQVRGQRIDLCARLS